MPDSGLQSLIKLKYFTSLLFLDEINYEYGVDDDNADYVHESYIPQHSGTRRLLMWKVLAVVPL